MELSQGALCCLGILCLICLPASTFPHTNQSQGDERRNDGSCRPNQFYCKSGLCVDSSSLCDGAKDCDDGSDETEEACGSFRCSELAFQCGNGACINRDEICDGISQCVDGSDEYPKLCGYAEKSKRSLSKECGEYDSGSSQGSWLPWFATLYRKFDRSFTYICSGSIVSSRAIISAAVCVYDEDLQKTADPSLFKVIVGRDNMKGSPTEKQFKVAAIKVPSLYSGHKGKLVADIAVLLLENKIEFNNIVSAICLDLKKVYVNDLTPGKSGMIGGWGGKYTDGTLKIHSVPYRRSSDCEENFPSSYFPFITSDKFCSGDINVSTVCRGDNGAGFATRFPNGKWYLSGLVSVGVPSKSECNPQYFYALTDVSQYYDFLENFVKEDVQITITCNLPEQPENGQYKIAGAQTLNIDTNPGGVIPGGVALIYTCHPGYILHGSSVIVCNNDWSSDPPTCSKIQCSPLIDQSREIDCSFNGEDVSCMDPAEPGTRATLRCRTNFEIVPSLSIYSIVCEKHGNWSREVQSCVPKCGIPNPQGITLISNGKVIKRSEYPWHIGLYKFEKDGTLNLYCSGSLVSLRVIVTAAHCFPEDTANNVENVMRQYRVVAGKYYRDWSETSKHTQHLNMENIVLHKRYRGGSRNYINDIAVIVLKYEVRIDETVRPVCVDFDRAFSQYFIPGIVGTVLGWGYTKNQTWSDVLLSANLPYVSQPECEKNTPMAFHSFLLGDKFCAGHNNVTVCQGDSGGGYAVKFPQTPRWYLVGVVSIGVSQECGAYPYAAFTNVYSNLEFVRNFVDEYN